MQLPADHLVVDAETRLIPSIDGRGLFLLEPVSAGALVAVFGGRAIPAVAFQELPSHRQRRSIQVADDIYLVGDETPSAADLINHSCDPTTLLTGEITIVAARDLEPGEQITFDYATSDSTPYDEFECECGSANCRGKVTGEDWMDPGLQQRYAGHFSPYLQRRIDRLGS